MSIINISLRSGMNYDNVNRLVKSIGVELLDGEFKGSNYKHNWKCKCGNTFIRTWSKIKTYGRISCSACYKNSIIKRQKENVEISGRYKHIESYLKGDTLPNGDIANIPYLKVEHVYCGNIYITKSTSKLNEYNKCSKCCGSYENSFAHHIEVELGLKLEDVWDFEKNTLNPYHISKGSNGKVWIKCQDKDYHGSYEVSCDKFTSGRGCPYCSKKGGKVHRRDSFGQWLKDEGLLHLWSSKNNIDPFTLSLKCEKKIWVLCDKHDYHNDYGGYETMCCLFYNKNRCPYCWNQKVHPYDSFGYHNFDKAQSWHPDNNISPFRVAKGSGKKYKFICHECGEVFLKQISDITTKDVWCPVCSASKGEKKVSKWLNYNNVNYIYDKPYFDDLLSDLGNPLRPDFILPEYKMWIEYDGEFHYKDFYKDGSINKQKYHDKLKDEYAKKHNWKLIRIPYWEFDNIEKILIENII